MNQSRENFGSKFTAIMAMAGSAIGLGNIWRFPYMVGQNGGAAFIIVYLIAAVLLCIPIFLSESMIGRRTQSSTFDAMDKLVPGTNWKWLGFLTVFTPLIIFSYYSVVGGWSIEYLLKAVSGSLITPELRSAAAAGAASEAIVKEQLSAIFGTFITATWAPLIFFTLFMAVNAVVVIGGIKGGIEKFTKITTPVLFVLILLIMVYSLSLPGSIEGVKYLVKPDFSKMTSSAILSAMGQAFFSLSLGVGCILTYASYIKKEDNLLSTGLSTVIFDLFFALIAGFAIMPAVFAAGIEPGAGPGLIFETLPFIFAKMGVNVPALSYVVAVLFFVTILFAALTSSISMLETGVAYMVDHKNMSRVKATLIIVAGCWTLGILCSLSYGPLADFKILNLTVFDFCDKMTSDFLMTFGSVLFTVFLGWRMSKETVRDEFTNGGTLKTNAKIFDFIYFMIKYVAPVVIVVIFVSNLLLK